MPNSPEVPKSVVETRPENIEVPANLAGEIKPVETQFTAKVNDDKGQPMLVTPQTQNVTIQLPASELTLIEWAKGVKEDAKTWWAAFWLRFKKIKELKEENAS